MESDQLAEPLTEQQQREYEQKLKLYLQMTELHPSEPKYHRRLVEILLLTGREEEALLRMRRLERLYKHHGQPIDAEAIKKLRKTLAGERHHPGATLGPLLAGIDPEAIGLLTRNSRHLKLKEGETLIRQGEEDDRIFIVDEGELAVLVQFRKQKHPTLISVLGEGNIVGETTFLEGGTRNATVVANRKSNVLELCHKRVLQCLLQYPEIGHALREESLRRKHAIAINSNRYLAKLDEADKERLAEQAVTAIFDPFRLVSPSKGKQPWVGIMLSGLVRSVVEDRLGNSHLLTPIKPGDLLGDVEALGDSESMADMVAVTETAILQIPATIFAETMSRYPAIKQRLLETSSERIASTMVILNQE